MVKIKARYKLTESLSEYINAIREKTLGYTYDEFSEILNIEPSSGYYLCKHTRTQYITIEKLISIFAVKYNMHLFMLKSEKMLEIVEQAKKDGKIDKKMTLKDIFGTRSSISETRNKLLVKPPIEIFTEQKCPVRRDVFLHRQYNPRLFDEELFPPELRYVLIPKPNDLENPSEKIKSDLIRIKSYIGEEMDLLMKQADKYDLKSEYWVISLYFMYKDITISTSCWEFIRKCYNTNSWLNIFKTLGKNANLKRAYTMEDEDIIYFRDRKENEITEDNLPVFYYKYKSSLDDKIDFDNDYYEPERENAVNGKMKLIHLFYIIYNHYMNDGKTENEAFKETCFRLYADNVDSTFIKFDILNYPYVKSNMNLDSSAFKLYQHIQKFFDDNIIDEKEDDLLIFKKNCEELGSRFFDVISIDFTFIKKLNTTLDEKLKHNLNRTTNEFKKNILL